ncbi:MAG: hypothetical protein Q4G21_11245 [Dermabacter sp.]|nr:hypothetical protein [Dermabacter sp.]
METFATGLVCVGGILVAVNLILGFLELANIPNIRLREPQTFNNIRIVENLHQTVIKPAIIALVTGLFVSLSASFLYEGLTSQSSRHLLAGAVTLNVAVLFLGFLLQQILEGVSEHPEIANNPFTICAKAEEITTNPHREELNSDNLALQLNEWEKYIGTHSLNLSVKVDSPCLERRRQQHLEKRIVEREERLKRRLEQASQAQGFRSAICRSLHVYGTALRWSLIRFGWPLLGFTLSMVGAVWYAIGPAELNFTASWMRWAFVASVATLSAVPTLFYCVMRGNRAQLLYRRNLREIDDARKAIDSAATAHAEVAEEEARFKRALARAELFRNYTKSRSNVHSHRRISKFRVSIDNKPRSSTRT